MSESNTSCVYAMTNFRIKHQVKNIMTLDKLEQTLKGLTPIAYKCIMKHIFSFLKNYRDNGNHLPTAKEDIIGITQLFDDYMNSTISDADLWKRLYELHVNNCMIEEIVKLISAGNCDS